MEVEMKEPWYTSYKCYAVMLFGIAILNSIANDYAATIGWLLAAGLAVKLSKWQRMP